MSQISAQTWNVWVLEARCAAASHTTGHTGPYHGGSIGLSLGRDIETGQIEDASWESALPMLGVFAEFERSIIQERIHAGIARARIVRTKSGKPIGRAKVDRTRLQSSRSTYSCASFPSFFAFKEGMLETHISALLSSPTVSDRFLPRGPQHGFNATRDER